MWQIHLSGICKKKLLSISLQGPRGVGFTSYMSSMVNNTLTSSTTCFMGVYRVVRGCSCMPKNCHSSAHGHGGFGYYRLKFPCNQCDTDAHPKQQNEMTLKRTPQIKHALNLIVGWTEKRRANRTTYNDNWQFIEPNNMCINIKHIEHEEQLYTHRQLFPRHS